MPTALCPAQQQLFDRLLQSLPLTSVLVIHAQSGMERPPCSASSNIATAASSCP
jgi:hypothetical protein